MSGRPRDAARTAAKGQERKRQTLLLYADKSPGVCQSTRLKTLIATHARDACQSTAQVDETGDKFLKAYSQTTTDLLSPLIPILTGAH